MDSNVTMKEKELNNVAEQATKTVAEYVKDLRNFIFQAGCITDKQIYKLFSKYPTDFVQRSVIKQLLVKKDIVRFGTYLCPKDNTANANHAKEACLWIALDIIKYRIDLIGRIIQPELSEFCVLNNNTVYEIAYIFDGNTSNLAFMKEKYNTLHRNCPEEDYKYVLVIEDKNMKTVIESHSINFPYIISLIDMSEADKIPKMLFTKVKNI